MDFSRSCFASAVHLGSKHLPTGADYEGEGECLSDDSFQHIVFLLSEGAVFGDDFNLIADHITAFQMIQVQCFAGIAMDQQQANLLFRFFRERSRRAVRSRLL